MVDADHENSSAAEQRRRRRRKNEDKETDEADDTSSSEEESGKEFAPSRRPMQSPQSAIDKLWKRQASEYPGKVVRILPKPKRKQTRPARRLSSIVNGENAIASYDEAVRICRERVEAIAKECRRLNHKYIDPDFDIGRDPESCLLPLEGGKVLKEKLPKGSPGSIKRVREIFDNPRFFPDVPASNDIRQGRLGNCWVMSALCALSNKSGLIEKLFVARDEEIGVYGFVFHRDGDWFPEIIDDKLFLIFPDYDRSNIARHLFDQVRKEYDSERVTSEEEYQKLYQRNSGALYFGSCRSPNHTWLPLLEKAFAKAHGDYYTLVEGNAGEAIEDFTGGVTTSFLTSDILDKDKMWAQMLDANKEFLFTCSAGSGDGRFVANLRKKGIVANHAYTVKRAVEMDGQRLVLVRNPWGETEWRGPWSDGSKEWTSDWMIKLGHQFGDDGLFWISYDDLLNKYPKFGQTRLFTSDWQMAQKWTALEIPWIFGEHKTKFCFTLSKRAPVVVVLSQLDHRYFLGFQGRYVFSLGFSVRKVGQKKPIASTYQAPARRRSVWAELTLDAGTYEILMRIEGKRSDIRPPIDYVLKAEKNTTTFRKKMLRLARSYETAHARGRDEDSEEEKKLQKKRMAIQKMRDLKKYKKHLMKAKRQFKHNENRKKRKAGAARDRRKLKKPKKANSKGRPQALQIHEEPGSGNEAELPRTRSQAKGKKKAPKVRASRAAPQPEDVDEPENASSDPNDYEESDLNSEISEISDTEVEELFLKMVAKKMEMQARKQANKSPDMLAQARLKERERKDAEEGNEFELDPWNAAVVVGLRVYSKLSDVTLDVIRPEYEDSESEESEEEAEAEISVGGVNMIAGVVATVANIQAVGENGDEDDGEEEMIGRRVTEVKWLEEEISPLAPKFFSRRS